MNTQIPSFQQAPVVGCDGSSRRALQPAPTCPSHVTAARRIRQALAMRSKQPGAPRTRSGHTSIAAGAVSEGWWKTYPDLWIEVDDEHAFEALLRQHTDKLLVVDFWGKTCKGCEAVYLQLCRVAGDSDLQKKVTFVKVCVDGMVDRTKAEGVKALPYVGFYDGKQGKLGGSVTNPTQAKHMRRNILTVLDNPGKVFSQDPNGFFVAKDPPTQEATDLKAQQLAKMEEETRKIRKHLLGEYFEDVPK